MMSESEMMSDWDEVLIVEWNDVTFALKWSDFSRQFISSCRVMNIRVNFAVDNEGSEFWFGEKHV